MEDSFFTFFKGYHAQILPDTFLNTLSHILDFFYCLPFLSNFSDYFQEKDIFDELNEKVKSISNLF